MNENLLFLDKMRKFLDKIIKIFKKRKQTLREECYFLKKQIKK